MRVWTVSFVLVLVAPAAAQKPTDRGSPSDVALAREAFQAHQKKTADKNRAISDVLNLSDSDALLKASRYGEDWIARRPRAK